MSFGTTQFSYTHSSVLPLTSPSISHRGLSTALHILHQHLAIVRLNPIVTSAREIGDDGPHSLDIPGLTYEFSLAAHGEAPYTDYKATGPWRHYEVVDALPVVFGWSIPMTYHVALRDTSDGLESFVNAPSNVTIHGSWVVRSAERDPGMLEVIETSETRCSRLLAWYIKATLAKSHEVLHQNLKKLWEDDMGDDAGLRSERDRAADKLRYG